MGNGQPKMEIEQVHYFYPGIFFGTEFHIINLFN